MCVAGRACTGDATWIDIGGSYAEDRSETEVRGLIDNLTKLREVQLELLETFASTCEVHQLRWYAFFGTLLGVVRNEGYLPWDDDIDVVMPMKDYTELCKHGEWFDTSKYFLQTPLDHGCGRFAKLRKNGTTAFRDEFIEELRTEGHHGISIDIIPLAEIPGADCYHTPTLMDMDKREAVYLKSWFEPYGTGKFEHLQVYTPAKPRKILNEVYEDWAWPHGARESKPSYWFFDTEIGYEFYVKRYTGMLNGIKDKNIYPFGAADSLRIWLEKFGLRDQVVCTFDNDPNKWGKKIFDVEVRDPAKLPDLLDYKSRVIIVSLWHQEIGRQLERMGVEDYYVYLDDYYDDNVGNKVTRREDFENGDNMIPKWE